MFSYVSLEQRVPQDHPLRAVRKLTDTVLRSLSAELDALYADSGRPSIAPEYILRALLLQVFYSVRSERLLVLVEVPHVQVEVPLAIEPQHLLDLGQRYPPAPRRAPPPVEQTVVTMLLVALSPAPHRPVADADNLRCLPPAELLRHCPEYHFLYLRRPLHGAPRISVHAPDGLLTLTAR